MKKKRIVIASVIVTILAVTAVIIAVAMSLRAAVDNGTIVLNQPAEDVTGIAVSNNRGQLDWKKIAGEDIDFVYIKATDGSKYKDISYLWNTEQAQKAGLKTGAYHHFQYKVNGKKQAKNYISSVPKAKDQLPPVISLDFYGKFDDQPVAKAEVDKELKRLIDALKAHYGVMPMIYATGSAYDMYVSGEFPKCGIWIRNVYSRPSLSDGRPWMVWQYTDKGKLEGLVGKNSFIALNVWCGTREEWEKKYGHGLVQDKIKQ